MSVKLKWFSTVVGINEAEEEWFKFEFCCGVSFGVSENRNWETVSTSINVFGFGVCWSSSTIIKMNWDSLSF